MPNSPHIRMRSRGNVPYQVVGAIGWFLLLLAAGCLAPAIDEVRGAADGEVTQEGEYGLVARQGGDQHQRVKDQQILALPFRPNPRVVPRSDATVSSSDLRRQQPRAPPPAL